MKTEPRFSIVVPCFNQGAFIQECLQSLRAQTLQPHEIIVVNDGSTDAWTVAQLEAQCRAPVQLIHQGNRGLAGARNSGIGRATGDWIIPLDCDDQLEPFALEAYAAAIHSDPSVDVWYPDIIHFGVENDVWRCSPFNAWRQLWSNQMVCSSAIRRTIFDCGVLYNERMRQGYEDWEFYIHACCEKGFSARALGKAVFRYRRWGHSMLSDSNSKAAQVTAQLRAERPIFQDANRLNQLKARWSPYFSIAAQGPGLRVALESQCFKDFRVVEETGRVERDGDLVAFQDNLGAGLVISLSDEGLSHALGADPFLLEKAARTHALHTPGLMWLVTEHQKGAYPGFLVERASSKALAVIVSTRHLFERPELMRTGAGLIADLEAHLEGHTPGSSLYMIAGPDSLPGGVDAPLPRVRLPVLPDLSGQRAADGGLGRVALIGLGISKVARGLLGPRQHDRLLSNTFVQDLRLTVRGANGVSPRAWMRRGRRWLRRRSGSEKEKNEAEMRRGPIQPAVLGQGHWRESAWFVATERPRFPEPPAELNGLLVVVPWIIHGGVDRAIVDLLKGMRRIQPDLPLFVATTIPASNAWAEQVLPHVDGVFSLHAFGSNDYSVGLVELVRRLGVKTLMIANSRAGFDALPRLRRELPAVRVVVQAHNFEPDPDTGRAGGHVAYVASRYNNLVHAYCAISQKVAETMHREFYVSPAKIRVVYLGVDAGRFIPARRERFDDRKLKVLWLGRFSEEKNPGLALEVAAEWRRRHGEDGLHITMVGDGPLRPTMDALVREKGLEGMVDLSRAVEDPVPLYRAADCLLLTSKYEGTPLVVFEALAAGVVPVTAISNSCLGEYVSPDLAFVAEPPHAPSAFVTALEEASSKRKEAKARAAAGLAVSARFDTMRYVRETFEVLFPDGSLVAPMQAAS